ncbi:DUF3278 domain-containing protein [Streptococcus cuniculi]|nr:DUF3278 domain-containing protein [Streptococcus cuniculi]MBF0778002.1 DUF3278 domain-containing protein [Streptococcus cuniculi]
MKETVTEKMIKRFYGITGPLDEYKRREVERIGNSCFVLLFWLLLIGNAIALLLSDTYPEVVASAYPITPISNDRLCLDKDSPLAYRCY